MAKAFIKLPNQEYQELVIDSFLDTIQNAPHIHPCPNCGDFRIFFDLAIPNFILTCHKCKYSWTVPMSDGDLERYTNIELNRIIAMRVIPEPALDILMRESIVIQIKAKRNRDIAAALLSGHEYQGYQIPKSLWGR